MKISHLLIDPRTNGHNVYVDNWEELSIKDVIHTRYYALESVDYNRPKFALLVKWIKFIVKNSLGLYYKFGRDDILVLHGTKNYIWLLPFYFAKSSCKFIVIHESINKKGLPFFLLRFILIISRSIRLISVYETSILTGYIYLPPTVSSFFRLSEHRKFEVKNKYDFISVGNLNPLKGFDVILNTFVIGKWCSKYSIYGGEYITQSTYIERLRNLVGLRIADGYDIAICGKLEVEQVRVVMRSNDILLLPSRSEASPIVVLEALALGIPVIASRVGDLSCWKEKFSGLFLVDFTNHTELSEVFEKLNSDSLMMHTNKSHPIIRGDYYRRFHDNIVLNKY